MITSIRSLPLFKKITSVKSVSCSPLKQGNNSARSFFQGNILRSSSHPEAFAANVRITQNALEGKQNVKDVYQKEYFHYTSIGLASALPVAFALSPSVLNGPVDLILAFLIPAHTQLGMSVVIDDYIHGSSNKLAKIVLIILTVVMLLGLLQLNFKGIGITESIKQLWRKEDVSKRINLK
eukprot:TRINITY_DN9280_c0_g1_i1.p1 TRINITY_DN9280_c0_g1~~TRINITY_DN9280_c0_g1_i1.p1  ORF type:complete len:180 (-),score=33.94 TRINITY_DN9280_c0_g1_i1:208-747(-)